AVAAGTLDTDHRPPPEHGTPRRPRTRDRPRTDHRGGLARRAARRGRHVREIVPGAIPRGDRGLTLHVNACRRSTATPLHASPGLTGFTGCTQWFFDTGNDWTGFQDSQDSH